MQPCVHPENRGFSGMVSMKRSRSYLFHFFDGFWRSGQIFITIFGNVDIIFNAHSTNAPVAFQRISVDVFFEFRRADERVDDKSTEINLYQGTLMNWSMKGNKGNIYIYNLHLVQQ